MAQGMSGVLIPVVAIIATFAVPIVAIVMDYRRRRLHFDERRAMIEKGMVPPPLDEGLDSWGAGSGRLATLRERSLRQGTMLLLLGLGLGVAFVLMQYIAIETYMPRRVVPMLAIGAAIITSLGIGNLIYYKVSGRQRPGPHAGDPPMR